MANVLNALVCLGLLLSSFGTWADRVTPSDRVQTRLRIRHNPDSQSTIVGWPLPGESLSLKSSVAGWYEVGLANDESGFVSQSWARLILDSAQPVESANDLRLGSWNVRKLGHGANKDVALLVQVIDTHYDIVVIVEVMQKSGGHPGYDSLIAALGQDWSGVVTGAPRPDTSSGSAEFYAIFFRSARIRLCDGWTGLQYVPDSVDVFSREPAFACFATLLDDGSTGFDFLLAAYHARWADGDISDNQGEVQHLDDVFSAMAATRLGKRDLLVAGDFNLVPSDLEAAVSRLVGTVGTGSTLNSSGEVTQNVYDHLIVFDATATRELMGPAEVLDVRNVAANDQTFFQTVSDHLPIAARLRVIVDDD